ncbi:MAG: hypothetical protein M3014_03410 [Chloroflexota bacterium]|nr:hypothetical protein [Chloroflexota bacterium]
MPQPAQRYQTSEAFRTALEARLKHLSEQIDLARLRRIVAFERLLARLFTQEGESAEVDPPWMLKGGYSFELRIHTGARSTKDLDITKAARNALAVAYCLGIKG